MSELNDVTLDHDRAERLGLDEAILCAGKSAGQIAAILDEVHVHRGRCLLTRLGSAQLADLGNVHRDRIDYDALSKTAFYGPVPTPGREATIAVVTAGTSDTCVGREAIRTLEYHSEACLQIYDVGVAGLWRLLEREAELRTVSVIIAVAGMDGALPSVIGGLVPALIIAVPTSTGYGAARAGETALHAALSSCAPGVVVVNIDNGYGAACAALRVVHAHRVVTST